MPAGGRGYTRPPSLISLWSTAPFLLNNTVGPFESSPSVEARMRSFQSVIEQMLWPEKRDKDSLLGDKIPGLIDRTSQPTYLRITKGIFRNSCRSCSSMGCSRRFLDPTASRSVRFLQAPRSISLANVNLLSEDPDPAKRLAYQAKVADLVVRVVKDLAALPKNATNEQAQATFRNLVEPLMAVSKCPDFIVNRGHYFGTTLPDRDKRALIEFLKTF